MGSQESVAAGAGGRHLLILLTPLLTDPDSPPLLSPGHDQDLCTSDL